MQRIKPTTITISFFQSSWEFLTVTQRRCTAQHSTHTYITMSLMHPRISFVFGYALSSSFIYSHSANYNSYIWINWSIRNGAPLFTYIVDNTCCLTDLLSHAVQPLNIRMPASKAVGEAKRCGGYFKMQLNSWRTHRHIHFLLHKFQQLVELFSVSASTSAHIRGDDKPSRFPSPPYVKTIPKFVCL